MKRGLCTLNPLKFLLLNWRGASPQEKAKAKTEIHQAQMQLVCSAFSIQEKGKASYRKESFYPFESLSTPTLPPSLLRGHRIFSEMSQSKAGGK
ncbi:hypothetical protein NPIL_444301 [Nephila pilipes]|uniref:Uncharacterized protein n=1 Tax=Nephila pilipes TaxID=299642 RepID=A0A8X6J629_NEPPI|nr:hypothetical protein NPIL_444301 [Nephila pilipes]